MKQELQKLDWMSDSTKQMAKTKLNAFLKKIGYPAKWKNYDDVTIDRANSFGNVEKMYNYIIKKKCSIK